MNLRKVNITRGQLEGIIHDVIFKNTESNNIMLHTGHGGCIEGIKAAMTARGLEHTWRNFRQTYLSYIRLGWLEKVDGCYKFN